MVMETGRRDFLKLLGLAGAAATMPKIVLAQLEEAEVVTPIEETPPFATLQFITPKKTYQLGILKQIEFPQPIHHYNRYRIGSYEHDHPILARKTFAPMELGAYIEHKHLDEIHAYMHDIMYSDKPLTRVEYCGDVVGRMEFYNKKIVNLKIKDTFIQGIGDIALSWDDRPPEITFTLASVTQDNVEWNIS